MEELTSPAIDFVILADRAEAVNGRLYMMGGGFDRLLVADFEQPVEFSIAVGVLVPWTAANVQHQLAVTLQHEDGRPVQPPLEIGVNVGRPPIAIPGQAFRTMIAIQGMFKLLGAGAYCVGAQINDQPAQRAVFYATPRQEIQGFMPQIPPLG